MKAHLQALLGLIAALLALAVVPSAAFASPGTGPLSGVSVCSAPAPGFSSCMAQVLTRSGRRVHPTSGGRISPSNVAPDVTNGYSPSDLQSAYDVPPNAAGLTVGIVDAYDNPNAEADLGVYRSHWGLPACTTANGCFRKVDQNGGANYPEPDPNSGQGWDVEIDLDIEAVSAVCPLCHIVLVEASSDNSSDLDQGIDEAVAAGSAVVSLSWGGPEYAGESSAEDSYVDHPGVAVMAAAGDDGYGTAFPAASPYSTAVGGTTLVRSGSSRGWSETAWSGTGSGCSPYEPKPSWQAGVTDSGCSTRMMNDVSAVANPNDGLAEYDSYQNSGGWVEVGGTSLSSPLVAGIYAVAGGEKAGTTGAHGFYSDWDLNDVTSGSNGSCTPSYFCNAGPEYDGPTGLGTPESVPVSATPGSVNFGSQMTGTTFASQTVTVNNNQSAAATTVNASITGPQASDFFATPGGNCASVLAKGACNLTVGFTPSILGTETATLTVSDTSSSGAHVIPLSGSSYEPMQPTVSGVSPNTGSTVGGTASTVTGTGFVPGSTSVTVGGASVTPTNVTTTSLTIVTPSTPLGGTYGSGVAQIVVTTSQGSSPTSSSSGFTYIPPGSYVPITPFRVLDTRASDCVQCNTNPQFAPGMVETLQVTGFGSGNIPSTATAVVLNVVAVGGTQMSYITVYPAGATLPEASNVNFSANTNLADLVQVALGPRGQVNIYNNQGNVDLVIDVEGYFTPTASPTTPTGAGLFHPLTPARICDTRGGQGTQCNTGADDPLGAGQTRLVQLGGQGGIPSTSSGAAAAAVNLAAVWGTADTYLTLYPASSNSCGAPPNVATINVDASTNLANRAMVSLSSTGAVCVYNAAGTINFIIDVNGWFGNGSESTVSSGTYFYPMSPARTCDTRSGTSTQCSGVDLGPGGTITVTVSGRGGVPTTGGTDPPVAVVANVTAIYGTSDTFFTVYPAGTSRPVASDINVSADTNLSNLVVVQLGSGAINIYNDAGTYNAAVDIDGWYAE